MTTLHGRAMSRKRYASARSHRDIVAIDRPGACWSKFLAYLE